VSHRFLAITLWLCTIALAESPVLFPLQEAPSPASLFPKEEPEPERAPLRQKTLYLTEHSTPSRTLYHREVIELSYKLLVLSEKKSFRVEFLHDIERSAQILNPNATWKQQGDGSFIGSFYLKINKPNYKLPDIKVTLDLSDHTESTTLGGREGKAISLDRNDAFAKVIAQEFAITDSKVTTYDNDHNLVVFKAQAKLSNLEDFSLAYFKRQGMESSELGQPNAWMIYFAIIPKARENLEFDVFNTQTYQYQRVFLPNVAFDDRVSTQSDIKPKNTLQLFTLSIAGFFAFIFWLIAFYKRSVFSLIIALALSAWIYFTLTAKDQGTIPSGTEIRILPTRGSTVIFVAPSATQVKILMEKNEFTKVLFEDEKIGWTRSEFVQKN